MIWWSKVQDLSLPFCTCRLDKSVLQKCNAMLLSRKTVFRSNNSVCGLMVTSSCIIIIAPGHVGGGAHGTGDCADRTSATVADCRAY